MGRRGTMAAVAFDDASAWDACVEAGRHDMYHKHAYHLLEMERGQGTPSLFRYDSPHGGTIALPLLLRDPPAGVDEGELKDATSVYGYAGPVRSGLLDTRDFTLFQELLAAELLEKRVVAVFSRLHPLLDQIELLDGIGTILEKGRTVSIGLDEEPGLQLRRYRSNHRRDIRKAARAGFRCTAETGSSALEEFVELYHETMERVAADRTYYFPRSYFDSLFDGLGDELHLFMCRSDGLLAAGGVFSMCDGVIQYHLGATASDYLRIAPIKLLFDEVRKWGNRNGARIFHLGGGVGSEEDSLLQFKLGFSRTTHRFRVWQWIVMPETYRELTESTGVQSESYFPAYRAPASG